MEVCYMQPKENKMIANARAIDSDLTFFSKSQILPQNLGKCHFFVFGARNLVFSKKCVKLSEFSSFAKKTHYGLPEHPQNLI